MPELPPVLAVRLVPLVQFVGVQPPVLAVVERGGVMAPVAR
jgi:hypothetical protein